MATQKDQKSLPRYMAIPTFMRTPYQSDPKGLDIDHSITYPIMKAIVRDAPVGLRSYEALCTYLIRLFVDREHFIIQEIS